MNPAATARDSAGGRPLDRCDAVRPFASVAGPRISNRLELQLVELEVDRRDVLVEDPKVEERLVDRRLVELRPLSADQFRSGPIATMLQESPNLVTSYIV
ncbi:hypothetical protein [Halomontanus rarus]|uniref:hypothetical protein n=1 Tax=Halomontanus rarus TaxID=3034020 RepID=UPI0023E7EEEA|nr:hypothetical protein [Halovivax sp. TS33]